MSSASLPPGQARAADRERLRRETFDLAIIGGGITGAGIARDAALRGFRAALLERGDFASGTSSRSARLAHGGLRYVEMLQFGVVRQACAERQILDRLAPHQVTPIAFTLPVYEKFSRYLKVRLGTWIYDRLGANLRPTEGLSVAQLTQVEPAIRRAGCLGAARYYERRVDDARLTLSTVLAARGHGALALNYAAVEGLLKSNGRLAGVAVRDQLTGETFEVRARLVVNASGAWNDQVRGLDAPGQAPGVRPNKGELPRPAVVKGTAAPRRTRWPGSWRPPTTPSWMSTSPAPRCSALSPACDRWRAARCAPPTAPRASTRLRSRTRA